MNKPGKCIFLLMVLFMIAVPSHAQENKEVQVPSLCIHGIIYNVDNPLVSVNEEVLGVGESIEGVRVTRISKDSVQFEYQGLLFNKEIGQGCSGEQLKLQKPIPEPRKFDWKVLNKGLNLSKFERDRIKKDTRIFIKVYGKVIIIVFAVLLGLYAYVSLSLQCIAQKTGTDKGFFAWLPILNLYLLCRIAQKPGWWFFLLFIPFVNIIVSVILPLEIARACRKSGWWGFLLLLPLINLFALGYLAFSKGSKPVEEVCPPEPTRFTTRSPRQK